jgi:hypothetical protein
MYSVRIENIKLKFSRRYLAIPCKHTHSGAERANERAFEKCGKEAKFGFIFG